MTNKLIEEIEALEAETNYRIGKLKEIIRKHQPEPQGVVTEKELLIALMPKQKELNGAYQGFFIIGVVDAFNYLRPYLQTNTAHPCREVREPESTGEDCGRIVQGGSISTNKTDNSMGELISKVIAVEIYDREIRYDGKLIYTGDVKNLGHVRIEQIIADYKAAKVSNSTGLEAAPDKAGDAGFTEEELLEIVYKKVHPTNGAIRETINALKAAGALKTRKTD